MPSLSKSIPMALSFLLTICLAVSARGDTVENLVFTGTATCNTGFVFQECSFGGPVAGNYSLDVTTQAIVGPWSFTTPYGVISSTDTGANGGIFPTSFNGTAIDEAVFGIGTTTPLFLEDLTLSFTGANIQSELGPLETIVPGFDQICQNVPGLSFAGCEPDVTLTGMTSLAPASTPEPGTSSLMLSGIGFLLLLLRRRKELAQGQQQAT